VKYWLQSTAAVLALAVCSTVASAQTAPSADRSAMRQMRQQMTQIRTQARTQMLGTLTPAHRTLLANVAGQLAVAATPNFRAAAQQLDTALSPTEKQAILAADTNARTQMRTAFQQMRSQMPSPPAGASPFPGRPPFAGPGGPGGPGQRRDGQRRQRTAGSVLLRNALEVSSRRA
jgi:hypothetical protein